MNCHLRKPRLSSPSWSDQAPLKCKGEKGYFFGGKILDLNHICPHALTITEQAHEMISSGRHFFSPFDDSAESQPPKLAGNHPCQPHGEASHPAGSSQHSLPARAHGSTKDRRQVDPRAQGIRAAAIVPPPHELPRLFAPRRAWGSTVCSRRAWGLTLCSPGGLGPDCLLLRSRWIPHSLAPNHFSSMN